jgi:regulator of PEP synthase PpsR (kinase-PPPase family)
MSEKQKGTLYIISDGTGETASTMIRAALVQYQDREINLVRCKNVRTESQIDSVIEQAFQQHAMIVYTVVSHSFRQKNSRACQFERFAFG